MSTAQMITILNLPIDIIERFMKELDAVDLESFIAASPAFREISDESKVLWARQAVDLLDRWRTLSLPNHNVLTEFSIQELKDAVFKAAHLERNWNYSAPRLVMPVVETGFRAYRGKDDYTTIERIWGIASNYMLYSTKLGRFVVWDTKANVQLGEVTFSQLSNRDVENCVMECVKNYVKVYCITRPNAWTSDALTETGNIDFRSGTFYKVVCVEFPTTRPSTREVEVIDLASFPYLRNQLSGPILLIPERKLIITLYPDSNTHKITVFLMNWETGNSRLIGTDKNYRFLYGHSLTLFPNRDEIIYRAMTLKREKTFIIPLTQSDANANVNGENLLPPIDAFEAEILAAEGIQWFGTEGSTSWGGIRVFQKLFYYPWRTTFSTVPEAVLSTCLIKKRMDRNVNEDAGWDLMQYYSTADNAIFGRRRCKMHFCPIKAVNEIHNPPCMDVGFRHVIWIERVSNSDACEEKRLMLASFPCPVEDPDGDGEEVEVEARKDVLVDVPLYVLDDANRVLFDEAEGSVIIVRKDGTTYTLRYA